MVSQPTERRTLTPLPMALNVGMWIACTLPQRSFWEAAPTWPQQQMSTGELVLVATDVLSAGWMALPLFAPPCPQLLHDSGWNCNSLWSQFCKYSRHPWRSRPSFRLGIISVCLQQDLADGMRMDIMWRPSLPELKAGKADTDCPSEVDYYEVCYMDNVWQNKD